MPTDITETWGDKLAELVQLEVVTPPPAENAVHARLTGIDGAGIAVLVSQLKKVDEKKDDKKKDDNETVTKYDGFALVFQHEKNYKKFEWLQFITRQLVVDNTAKTGNLLGKTNTASYQLVNSTAEITDYTLARGPKPDNWNSCWNVDSRTAKVFFRDTYEYAISHGKTLTAVLDAPSPMAGAIPMQSIINEYRDVPEGLVEMKVKLSTHKGISRAYFSDYLVKKDDKDDTKYHIVARFDFNLTWDPVTANSTKKNSTFTLSNPKSTVTTELLECHTAALLHKTTLKHNPTEEGQPWKSFHDSILPKPTH
jgi:hypothetical protein